MTIGLVFQWSAVFEKKRLHHFLIIASKTTCYVAEGRELHPNLIEILWRFVNHMVALGGILVIRSFGRKTLGGLS